MPPSGRFIAVPTAYLGPSQWLMVAGLVAGDGGTSTNGHSVGESALLRTDPAGIHPIALAWFDEGCTSEDHRFNLPFCKDQELGVSPDGRFAFVVTDSSNAGPTALLMIEAFTVGKPDTRVTTKVELGPRPKVRTGEGDSLKTRMMKALQRAPGLAEAYGKLKQPTYHPGFDMMLVSSDGTAWIGSPDENNRKWVLVSSSGNVQAQLQLPANEIPVASSGHVVWTKQADADGFLDLRMYQFGK